MGRITINFSEVEGGFEAVPEGMYNVAIEKVEVRESKSSDHDYLNWELSIQGDDYSGQRLWMITSLSPRALFRLKDVFQALDVLDDEMALEWDDDVDVTPTAGPMLLEPDVVGMEAIAVVTNEVYEGKERNRVNELRPVKRSGNGTRSSAAPKTTKSKSSSSRNKSQSQRRALR